MTPIRKLDDIVGIVQKQEVKRRIVLASADDPNALDAVRMAGQYGFASFILVGDQKRIARVAENIGLDLTPFTILHEPDQSRASEIAVRLCKENRADALMKGSVSTDVFLKSVLNKENGLLKSNARMSYVCALEIPAYPKLLLVSDTAVVPYPDFEQKKQMIGYSIAMANKLGITQPKVALIGASEKNSSIYHYANDYQQLIELNEAGFFGQAVIDGPLDVFLACHPESTTIKKYPNKIRGEADILIFPSLESANSFYKGLMLFADARLGGLIQGTETPVIVMSRSESPESKLYCMAMACLMA